MLSTSLRTVSSRQNWNFNMKQAVAIYWGSGFHNPIMCLQESGPFKMCLTFLVYFWNYRLCVCEKISRISWIVESCYGISLFPFPILSIFFFAEYCTLLAIYVDFIKEIRKLNKRNIFALISHWRVKSI